jgi:hypothetical protein
MWYAYNYTIQQQTLHMYIYMMYIIKVMSVHRHHVFVRFGHVDNSRDRDRDSRRDKVF